MQYKVNKFKDGQFNVICEGSGPKITTIKERINSYEDLFKIAHIKEVLDFHERETRLFIPCLFGQRSDRRFSNIESFDLKVICNFINSLNFKTVEIFHPHSDVAAALINNSYVTGPKEFIKKSVEHMKDSYHRRKPVLVSPDAGAYKNVFPLSSKLGLEMIAANKVRGRNGEPIINVIGEVKDKNCLIVDDLADGGRTFKFLAQRLKELGARKVCLYVSHAQFNFGFDELVEHIDHFYCTDSYRVIEEPFLTQFKLIE